MILMLPSGLLIVEIALTHEEEEEGQKTKRNGHRGVRSILATLDSNWLQGLSLPVSRGKYPRVGSSTKMALGYGMEV